MMHLAENLNILALITIAGASAISPSTRTYLGCFSSTSETFSADFVALGAYVFQSPGYCSNACFASGYSVFALTGGVQCLCGSAVPPSSDLVDATECSLPCQGYSMKTCGGSDALDVYSMNDDATGTALITAGVTAVPTTSIGYEYTALSSSGIGYLPVPDSSSSVITTTGPAVVVTAGSDSLTASLTSSSNSSSTTPAATTTSLHSSTAALVTPSATSATSAAKSPVSTGAAAGIRVQGIAQLISALLGLGLYMLF